MEILKEREFSHGGKQYIARLYKEDGNSQTRGAIFVKDNFMEEVNMKNIAREYLHQFGIKIPLTPNVNTHTAVKKLMDILDKNS
jgi:hypothetical protein